MNVVLGGFQALGILKGGPLVQIRKTAEHLRGLGVEVALHDPWTGLDPDRVDLVHLFSAGLGTYHLAREVCALDIPLVVSPITFSRHSSSFVRAGVALTRLAQRLGPGIWSDYVLMADMCRWAACVLPNSRAEADLVEQGLGVPSTRVTVVPNGVDRAFGEGDPELFRKKYGLTDFILNVGHIGHPRKNVLSLIRALGKIDHPAVIIGRVIRGPYGDACLREAERHRHILLIDGLEHDSALLASAYAAARVFVLPSQFETPGIAALEAGLAGATIVITPYGGTQEYFGDHAIYVEPRSEESIRDGIERGLARARSEQLRERIRTHYLWEHVAARTLEAYRNVTGGGNE